VLNLSAFAVQFMVQERYVYIPSIGFSLLLAQGLMWLFGQRRVSVGSRRLAEAAALVLIVILLSGKTLAQNVIWKDDQTLWAAGTEAAPDQPMPYFILGHKYISQRRFDKAIEQLEKYYELDQENSIVLNNLAAAHLYMYQIQMSVNPAQADRAHLDRAMAIAEKGLKIEPGAALYDTLGTVYTFSNNLWMAHAQYDLGLMREPDNAMIIFHKGTTYLLERRVDDALRYLELARQLAPNLSDTYKSLAKAYMVKGRDQEAVNSFNEYLRLEPNAIDRTAISQIISEINIRIQSQQPKG
jgi:tetratricopeptide (TPR) repeat protein